MSGFDENPFGEPTINDPFAVSILIIHSFNLILYLNN